MEKASIFCKKCNGRVLASEVPGYPYIDLTCLGCGWSRDVPKDVWANATKASLRQIVDKADKLEF